MVHFDIDPARTALVVVDMQNCFVADSPIAAPRGVDVAQRLNGLADACRQAGITVIWTRHTAAGRVRGDGVRLCRGRQRRPGAEPDPGPGLRLNPPTEQQ